MPLGPTDLFWIGLVPCALAALAMGLAVRTGLRPTAAWALAIGGTIFLGLTLQHLRVNSQTALDKLLHPRVGLDWLPWLVLVAALITALAAYAPRTWQRWLLALACVFTIATPLRLLASNAAAMSRWSAAEKLGVLACWSLLFAVLWATLALGRRNSQPLLRSTLLLVVTAGIALTLAGSGSITLGELTCVVAATILGAIAAASVVGFMRPDGPSSAAGPLAVALGGLILIGQSYELTTTNAVLLAFSLAASSGYLPEWPRQQIGRAAVRVFLTLVPLAIALALALSTATPNPYG
jgi:hypothetical protein